MYRLKSSIFLAILLFVIVFSANNVLAVGQITKPIVIDNAIRGQEYQETMMLVNSSETEKVFSLVAEGSVAEWVTFHDLDDLESTITEITIQAGGNANVYARFNLPEDVANGIYEGAVSVITIPQRQEQYDEKTVSVSQRVPRSVRIAVTGDEHKSLDAMVVPVQWRLKQGEVLEAVVHLSNTGNVIIRPDIQQRVLNGDEVVYNAVYPYSENNKGITPNTTEKQVIKWKTTDLEPGKYRSKISVLLENEIVEEKVFSFIVSPGGLKGIVLGIKDMKINWWVIGFSVAVIVFALFMMWRQKKKNISGIV